MSSEQVKEAAERWWREASREFPFPHQRDAFEAGFLVGAEWKDARYTRLREAANQLVDCWAEYPSGRLMIARERGKDAETAIISLRAALAELDEQGREGAQP